MPAGFLERTGLDYGIVGSQRDMPLAVRCFNNQETLIHTVGPQYTVPMTTDTEYLIHTDGGARGNPGPAAFAYTIEAPGQPAIEEKGYLGETTNNVAEYTGLIRALAACTTPRRPPLARSQR